MLGRAFVENSDFEEYVGPTTLVDKLYTCNNFINDMYAQDFK